jgi:hypothetical protein
LRERAHSPALAADFSKMVAWLSARPEVAGKSGRCCRLLDRRRAWGAARFARSGGEGDERNPPETGVMEQAMKRVTNGRLLLIPASEDSRGHATTGAAKVFAKELGTFLDAAPKRAM